MKAALLWTRSFSMTNAHRMIPIKFRSVIDQRIDPEHYRCYSNSSEDEKSGKKAKDKLNDLLQSMIEDSRNRKSLGKDGASGVSFQLAVPKRVNPNKKDKQKPPAEGTNAEPAIKEPELNPKLVTAVKSVAASLAGDPVVTENDLVQKLKAQQTEKINLGELFLGMKIDRTKKAPVERSGAFEGSRAQRVRQMLSDDNQREIQRQQSDRYSRPPQKIRSGPSYAYMPISLFGEKPVGIFTGRKKTTEPAPVTPTLATWDKIHEKELKLAVTHPPANGFEEMILWTEQGKFWHFPIDNEQGNDENTKYDFTDHVFLEPVIDSWCPKTGPIRQFMELVTVALSKNPYLSVPEKHEYLNWYHEYFKEKADIIKQVGAGEIH